jgi:hypothetical protein
MDENGNLSKIWIGVAIGAALGIGYAVTHRKRSRWNTAKDVSRKLTDHSGELIEVGRNIADRVRVIYEEGRKLVEDATEAWAHGRKLVGY